MNELIISRLVYNLKAYTKKTALLHFFLWETVRFGKICGAATWCSCVEHPNVRFLRSYFVLLANFTLQIGNQLGNKSCSFCLGGGKFAVFYRVLKYLFCCCPNVRSSEADFFSTTHCNLESIRKTVNVIKARRAVWASIVPYASLPGQCLCVCMCERVLNLQQKNETKKIKKVVFLSCWSTFSNRTSQPVSFTCP